MVRCEWTAFYGTLLVGHLIGKIMVMKIQKTLRRSLSFNFALMVGASTAALSVATPYAAAQDETASQGGLDTITVTAQRREENQQEVPISLTTLPSERVDEILQAGEDIRALATRVPGLYAESSNGRVAPRFYIRGLGNTDFDLAASQPVSVIMDEIVMENVVLKSFPLFDLDRVEVLRGPQGTLFGRNTPAGIVKFDTKKPTQEYEGYLSAAYGTFNTAKVEAALGGPLIEDVLAFRISGLVQRRDDWIDNAVQGTDDALGGFEDYAARVQVLWTPIEPFSALLNLHGRQIEGTSAIFRANIFDPGSNELNGNFDRDTVFFDEGNDNPQSYNTFGGSAKLAYDFGPMTLTSITGFETANGESLGDIDGGAGAAFLPQGSFPGFIPFPSATQDGIDDLDQFTQEVRLSSNTSGPLTWQGGFFYFASDLTITTNPFFVPATTVNHENESWAVFGQASYAFTDRLTFTGGVRYTDDQKDFRTIAANFPVAPVSVEDGQVSWDVSLAYALTDEFNVYGRIARGFRAPTIQGRDVAFFGAPTTADSETILSYELGFKSQFLDNRARVNVAGFYYDANDLQFSAIGGLGNFNQLVNADGEAWGFEADIEFLPTENLLFTAGVSYNDTEITEPGLQVAPCGGGCTVLDPTSVVGGVTLATIEGNPFPQAPDLIWNITARYTHPLPQGGSLYGSTDWAYQGETNFFLYESAEFFSDNNIEGGLRIGYITEDGDIDFAFFARNILDAENVKGGIDFNNLTGFVNEPRVVGASVTFQF